MTTKRVVVTLATLAGLALTSCAGVSVDATDQKSPTAATTQKAKPKPTATPTPTPTTPTPKATTPKYDPKPYLEALASYDPDRMLAARKLAVPGSVADAYLRQQADLVTADLDAGITDYPGTLTRDGDGYRDCETGDDGRDVCNHFAGFVVHGGKLADLTVNRMQIGPRLTMGNGSTVTAHGVTFQFRSAYKTTSQNALWVVVKVTTSRGAINVFPSSATYRAPDGAQRTAADGKAPDEIAARSSSTVAAVFPGVSPGGAVTLPFSSPDGMEDWSVRFSVGRRG
ncbi:hypothetical protein [Actinopolymorpha rutila]|uniref:Lipoprotein n=1 Tax=Actinopolymorpha rutila TaxID=446787 RepID=A0A852ZVW7_9ACTN|nr:hypothetical protein [Actinopolymorpha rutila]NYH92836.1 hypothetical protein [Actinopolymorpha rutila]